MHFIRRWQNLLMALFIFVLFCVGVRLYPHTPLSENILFSNVFYDDHHNLLRLSLTNDEKYRVWTPLQDISPLVIEGVPSQAKSLALIVDDPDAPSGTWVHWVVYDIPLLPRIEEHSVPGKLGANDSGGRDYGGPCPPSGTHRYFFKLYALDKIFNAAEGISKKDLEKMMQGHIVEKAELVGLYKRS